MTCNDCVHHDLCLDSGTLFLHFATTGRKMQNVETNCPFKNFKNKADFMEVKHGEWIKEDNVVGKPYMTCSACKTNVFAISEYDYCPCCGAKMDGQ